jgi:glycosyltransferase involved in cell wall biosynthesis
MLSKIMQRLADIRSIVKEATSGGFTFIYIHTAHGYTALLRDIPLAFFLSFNRTPVFALFHGSRVKSLDRLRNVLFYYGTEFFLRMIKGLLVLSTEEKNRFVSLWPWVKCEVVPNPIVCPDSVMHKPIPAPGNNGAQRVMVFAGRFIVAKGVLDVIDAFPRVLKRIDCRLIFAGDGPLRREMERRVERYNIADRVEFVGYLDRSGMCDLYRAADLLLLPSYSEGMPMVVLEAMANGLGLICTRTGGLADYLKEDEHVLFVPAHRPDKLADRVVELISDSAKFAAMRRANIKLAKDFRPEATALRHMKAIQSILGGHEKV